MLAYIKKNLFFLVAVAVLASIALNPGAKALVIKGLMKAGLFSPDLESRRKSVAQQEAELPSLLLLDHRRHEVNLKDLRGKVVFLNFWATWCPPCLAEMPSLNKLYKVFQNNANVVFVIADVDGDYEKAKAFMADRQYSLPVYSPLAPIPEELFKGSIPATLIFDKKGNIVFRHEGAADYSGDETVKFIRELSR